MVAALRSATLVMSDSGGIQKEAPALSVPSLVLRTVTERPEGVASGNNRLIGNDRGTIVGTVLRLLDDHATYRALAIPALPFGDGRAAGRIAELSENWLVRNGKHQRQIA